MTLTDLIEREYGSRNWVIAARRTSRLIARYGENVVALTQKRYAALKNKLARENGRRCVISFDGNGWYVCGLVAIEMDLSCNFKVYHCNKHVSGPHITALEAAHSAERYLRDN